MSFIYWKNNTFYALPKNSTFFLLYVYGTDSKTNLSSATKEHRWNHGPMPRNIIWKTCENKESEPQKIK